MSDRSDAEPCLRTIIAAFATLSLALSTGVLAQTSGWYVGVEGGINALDDAENRSRTPDTFNPGTDETCQLEIPGLACIVPETGQPASSTPGETQISESRFKDGLAIGLTIGRRYQSGARPELGLTFRENDFESIVLQTGFGNQNGTTVTPVDGRVRAMGLMGNFWYDMATGTLFEPYVGAGIGFRQIELGGGDANARDASDDSDTVFGWQAGAGATFWLTEMLSLSLDYRYVGSENPSFKTSQRQPLSSEYAAQSLDIGLRYVFSPDAPRDTDGDGVPDYKDRCPGTPPGVTVNERGCPVDSDGDGVPDHLDKCPNTPQGVVVDKDGCPLDSDGDGVPDHLDKCPNTPQGVVVGPDGCALDSDGDGVPDYLDKCPNTPAGVKVDTQGCPLDLDGDGVSDDADQCPGTPAGAEVMTDGCAVGQSQVLSGVTFEFNSARLNPNARELLRLTAQTLIESPRFRLEIQGHTCDLGGDSYNLKLSQQRAESVRNFLVSQGVDAGRLEAMGYGESQPIVPNASEADRELNRRVALKVLSK